MTQRNLSDLPLRQLTREEALREAEARTPGLTETYLRLRNSSDFGTERMDEETSDPLITPNWSAKTQKTS
jgi:hypothetical protein